MPFHVNDSFEVVNDKCENMRFVTFLRARDIDFFNCEVKAVFKVFARQLQEKKTKNFAGTTFFEGAIRQPLFVSPLLPSGANSCDSLQR